MASKKAEARQKRIYDYILEERKATQSTPSIREISQKLDIPSTSTVQSDLKALEEQGLIVRTHSKSRSVVPTCLLSQENKKPSSVESVGDAALDVVELPVIGRVAAGTPILAEQNIEDTMAFPSRFIGAGNNFILTVHGDSMINVGINDGDFLIVSDDDVARNGEIVVAQIEGEYESEMTVKTFYKENGHIRLQPENDALDPIIVDDCTIVGKVKGVFRYMN